MTEAYVDIAPLNKFKPIDASEEPTIDRLLEIDPDSSSDSLDDINMISGRGFSPTEIFRDTNTTTTTNMENRDDDDSTRSMIDNDDEEMGGLPFVRRANPIDEQNSGLAVDEDESDLDNDDDMAIGGEPLQNYRVISPYPFSHTSKEEMEDREQLTNVLEWSRFEERAPIKCHVDYSMFFGLNHNGIDVSHNYNDQVMSEDCDDFSLSSHEANSLSAEDDFLGSISEDPASFWDDSVVGFHVVRQIMSDRSQSPTQVSLGSAEE